MPAKTPTPLLSLTEIEELDEFYYGHRTHLTHEAQGRAIYSYKPLTLADFLDPEEGDHFIQGTLHHEDTDALKSIFRYLYRNDPTTAVFSDLKILWGIKGLARPAPDVMIIPDVKDPGRPRPVFDVPIEGTRPRFILEVVSPRYREPDRNKKVAIYERAGVEEYFIIDAWLEEEEVSYEVLGYRLRDNRYVEIPPNEQGWVFSEVNQVWLGISEDRKQFLVIDTRTGQPILPAEKHAEAEAAARQQAEARAAELEIRVRELQARYGVQSQSQDEE